MKIIATIAHPEVFMQGVFRMKYCLMIGLLATCCVAVPANGAVDINAGVVAEWLFEESEGVVVRDTSDNNNNAILKNGPTWIEDGIGTAMAFDGVDDYLDSGAGAKLDITEKVSLAAWVNPAKPSLGEPAVVGKDMSAYVLTWSGTSMYFYINAGHLKCSAEIPMNQWSHVVGTYDGNRLLLYINGELVSGYVMNTEGTPIDSRGDSVLLGRREQGYYCGMLDNVRIFDRPLSAKEVKSQYDEEAKLIRKVPLPQRDDLNGLALRVFDAGTTPKTLLIKGDETVEADLTIPSNIHLDFEMGGVIYVNEGAILKLEGPLRAPLAQIFAGPGSVVFGMGTIEKAYPQWWGATGNSKADDTAAIQAAMDAFPTGGVVSFPAGTYRISSTLKFYSGINLIGPARIRCVKAVLAIIESYNPRAVSRGLRIKGLSIDGRAVNGDRCEIGINFTNVCSSSLEDVGVSSCKTGIMMDGPIFCGYNSLMRMSIGACDVGIEFDNSAIKTTFIGSNIGNVETGVLVKSSNELDIFGLSIEGFRSVGIDVVRGDTIHMQHLYFANDGRGTGIRIGEGVSDCTVVQPRFSHTMTPIDNQSASTLILATGFENPAAKDKQSPAEVVPVLDGNK